jgi:hypothetical protein
VDEQEMSEEQSNFKVTDRRLFNPDGTPRDIEREEETSEASTATQAPASVESTAQTERATPAAPAAEQSETVAAEDSRATSAQPDDELSGIGGEASIPGADDPASFINFLMSIASNAASALGMMEHPVTGERGVDLQLGKHWIDILGMLQQKTKGNLHPQEEQIFEGLLADLRMQYVSLTNTAPRTPRGFSARDITGGK